MPAHERARQAIMRICAIMAEMDDEARAIAEPALHALTDRGSVTDRAAAVLAELETGHA